MPIAPIPGAWSVAILNALTPATNSRCEHCQGRRPTTYLQVCGGPYSGRVIGWLCSSCADQALTVATELVERLAEQRQLDPLTGAIIEIPPKEHL